MAQVTNAQKMASRVLGVDIAAIEAEIQYGYYRMMTIYHPDKNRDDSNAHRFAALINEAKDVMLGKETSPVLLKDFELVSEFMQAPVCTDEVLSYEEWLKQRFYNMEQCSIWPY